MVTLYVTNRKSKYASALDSGLMTDEHVTRHVYFIDTRDTIKLSVEQELQGVI